MILHQAKMLLLVYGFSNINKMLCIYEKFALKCNFIQISLCFKHNILKIVNADITLAIPAFT